MLLIVITSNFLFDFNVLMVLSVKIYEAWDDYFFLQEYGGVCIRYFINFQQTNGTHILGSNFYQENHRLNFNWILHWILLGVGNRQSFDYKIFSILILLFLRSSAVRVRSCLQIVSDPWLQVPGDLIDVFIEVRRKVSISVPSLLWQSQEFLSR